MGLLAHLGAVARERRLAGACTLTDIEQRTGIAASTISRFENGDRIPRRLDDLIDGYAAELEIDAKEIWREAIRRWT